MSYLISIYFRPLFWPPLVDETRQLSLVLLFLLVEVEDVLTVARLNGTLDLTMLSIVRLFF